MGLGVHRDQSAVFSSICCGGQIRVFLSPKRVESGGGAKASRSDVFGTVLTRFCASWNKVSSENSSGTFFHPDHIGDPELNMYEAAQDGISSSAM